MTGSQNSEASWWEQRSLAMRLAFLLVPTGVLGLLVLGSDPVRILTRIALLGVIFVPVFRDWRIGVAPQKKSAPRQLLWAGIAGVSAMGCAGGLVFAARELRDQSGFTGAVALCLLVGVGSLVLGAFGPCITTAKAGRTR